MSTAVYALLLVGGVVSLLLGIVPGIQSELSLSALVASQLSLGVSSVPTLLTLLSTEKTLAKAL